jgi:hypothetical protein
VVLADTELGENEGLENAIAAGGLRIRLSR